MIEYENLQKVNEKLFSEYSESFDKFLKSGWYILGNQVTKFEEDFLISVAQSLYRAGIGLDALVLAIDAYDFPKDSEIIVPANTYIATMLAIVRNGFKPVLVEPDIKTYNIDPSEM